MRIADKLSEVAEKAISAKKQEQIREAAAIRLRNLEKARLKKKEAHANKIAKKTEERNSAFLQSIDDCILKAAWRGEKILIKSALTEWQKNLLNEYDYKIEDNSESIAKITELLEETFPESVENLLSLSKSACQKFKFLENDLINLLNSNWRELNSQELNRWLSSIFETFKRALKEYTEIVRMREASKYNYDGLMSRLRPAYGFIKKHIDSIDTIYAEKLSENGLLGHSRDGERPFHEIYKKQVIIRRILTEESGFTWDALADSEIQRLFHAVRNDSNIESAASDILSNATDRFLNLRSIEFLSDFDDERSRIIAFKVIHDQVIKQESEIYECFAVISELAEAIGDQDDPLTKFNPIQHFYISPPSHFDNILLYNFLTGDEFKSFKRDFTNHLLRAAEVGLKTKTINAKEYENGIDIWSPGKRKVFLPMSLDLFLDFNHSDGLGYQVYQKGNFNWLIDIIWS